MSKITLYKKEITQRCLNCGADESLHRASDNACPRNGVEAHYTKNQEWEEDVIFENVKLVEATKSDVLKAARDIITVSDEEIKEFLYSLDEYKHSVSVYDVQQVRSFILTKVLGGEG